MLVLNRRPGESIVIEPDLRVTVLTVADRHVWITLDAQGRIPSLRLSASVSGGQATRIEIGPLSSVSFDEGAVRAELAAEGDPADYARAGLAIDRKVGERIDVGDDIWVAPRAASKSNPCIALGGTAIGEEIGITIIRPAGNYVRLGVDAPNRKVYREEIWDAVTSGRPQEISEEPPPGDPANAPAVLTAAG